MKNIKKELFELSKEFTKSEIADYLWINRVGIFNNLDRQIWIKCIEKILTVTWLKYEDLSTPKFIDTLRYQLCLKKAENYLKLYNEFSEKAEDLLYKDI